jgi:hypothetical protein
MAIGSGAEIGVTFTQGKLGDWLDGGGNEWRAQVGDDLLGGYANVWYIQDNPELVEEINREAIQMYPLQPHSEDTYRQVRANVLASWHARGIVLNETDGGS